LFVHILPNLFSIFLVVATAAVGQAILSEAALSFLGLGVPAPRPSLGGMVYEAQQWSTEAPWMAVFPGLVIASLVIGFNLLGDAVRDLLDPRQRER
jgi:peptide/nickel transport system permease protein